MRKLLSASITKSGNFFFLGYPVYIKCMEM